VMLGEVPHRHGSRDLLTAPANVFEARDGYLYIHAGTNPLFPRLCTAMGRPELARDPRFDSVPNRMENVEEIEAIVSAWTRERSVDELSEVLAEAGIPFGKVAEVADVVASPQIAAREMLVEVEHPTLGPLTLPGIPIKLSATPGSIRKAPPLVGEDNDRVYRDIVGLDDEELARLRAKGTI